MNYIELNGVRSTSITGLLIQSLPSISKPLIRTVIEEIDGKDGDTITKLGYAAYDKEVTIGLYGKFDIDRIISYFDSEGTVTFSNEPDKYYNYTIVNQIDFERLIRFRTASVTLHIQPFKYSLAEKARTYTPTGQSLSILNKGNTTARPKFTIYGSGTINLSLAGNQIFAIALGDEGYITIDTAAMEAYKGNVLKNRLVTGDFDNFVFNSGWNTITWSGTITSFEIENYSRWI